MGRKAFWLCLVALGLTALVLINNGGIKTTSVPTPETVLAYTQETLENLPEPNLAIPEERLQEVMGLGVLEIPEVASKVDVVVKTVPQTYESAVAQAPQAFSGQVASTCIPKEGFQSCEATLLLNIFRTNMQLVVTEMINNPNCGGDSVNKVIVHPGTSWSFNRCHPSNYEHGGGYNNGEQGGYIVGAGACNVATVVNSALVQAGITTQRRDHFLNVEGVSRYVPIPRADGSYFPQNHTVVIQAGTSGDLRFSHSKTVEMLFEINSNSIVVHVRNF